MVQTFLFTTHSKKYVLHCDSVVVYIHTWIYISHLNKDVCMYMYIYIHTYIYMCVCMCVCACVPEAESN